MLLSLSGAWTTLTRRAANKNVRLMSFVSNSSEVKTKEDSSSSKRVRAAKLLEQLPRKDLSDFVLTDTFGRHHNYLRISLTEKCNLRLRTRELRCRNS